MKILTPSLTVSGSSVVSKTRELPVKGEITVKVGDDVSPNDIVGKASPEGDIIILRAAEAMGIEPFEIEKGLIKKPGDSVKEGEVICEHPGLFGLFTSRFRSQVSGVMEYFSSTTGHIGIRLPARELTVRAYLKGRVISVLPGRAVTIESKCALVQGIFGVSGERTGIVHYLEGMGASKVDKQSLPKDLDEKIVCGGQSFTIDALKEASSRGAVGVITASIDDDVLKGYLGYDLGIALTGTEAVPMTLIVTEGFGDLNLSKRAETVLKECSGHLASMNGTTQVRAGAVRPELVIFDTKGTAEKIAPLTIEIGSTVRLIRVPNFGKLGEVIELPSDPKKLETGAYARVVRVRLEAGREVLVPRSNVELV